MRTLRSVARERSAVKKMKSDSGVVTRMCAGLRSIRARSAWVVLAGADRGADRRKRDGAFLGQRADLRERRFEVAADVVGQRLER